MPSTNYQRWDALADYIPLATVRIGTKKLLSIYESSLEWIPASVSGKYHQHQPLLIDHIEDCFVFARSLADAFNLQQVERSVLYSAVILHDIGKCNIISQTALRGDGRWKSYQDGEYYRNVDGYDHALLSQAIIARHKFQFSPWIGALTACHGGHWYKNLPQPRDLLGYLMVSIDYLSSHVVSDGEEVSYGERTDFDSKAD